MGLEEGSFTFVRPTPEPTMKAIVILFWHIKIRKQTNMWHILAIFDVGINIFMMMDSSYISFTSVRSIQTTALRRLFCKNPLKMGARDSRNRRSADPLKLHLGPFTVILQ